MIRRFCGYGFVTVITQWGNLESSGEPSSLLTMPPVSKQMGILRCIIFLLLTDLPSMSLFMATGLPLLLSDSNSDSDL